jgi:hypothetical protein
MTVSKNTRARRRAISAVRQTGRLAEQLGILGVALSKWAGRDDHQAEPEIRRAADTAMDAITGIARVLADLRSQLIEQIAASDEAAAARTRELVGQPAASTGLRPDASLT